MKRKCIALVLVMVITFLFGSLKTADAALSIAYYGSGNYVGTVQYTPVDGLRFYVDYYAISTFGSGPFASGFDWNGDYQANVAAIAQYPASATSYSNYFVISTDSALLPSVYADTLYYDSYGNCLNAEMAEPMDSSGIYRCRINLNPNDVFDNSAEVQRTVVHEIGHVFLLKHPTGTYTSSVMYQGNIGDLEGRVAATVTTSDRNNIIEKWGR